MRGQVVDHVLRGILEAAGDLNRRPAAEIEMAGGVGGGVHERHQRIETARIAAAARVAEQQRLVAAEQARQDEEDLLSKVDIDVSREVPSAMEPLAQLMAEDETK